MFVRLLVLREQAAARHDWMLVAEIDGQLAREGYVFETAIPVAQERTVPVKRGPGRPRKIPLES